MKPILKWPGGKRAILNTLMTLVPEEFKRYFEPFFGGGALYFKLLPNNSVLSDRNAELVNCYLQIRDHPEEVILVLSEMENSEEGYYRIRSTQPQTDIASAARLLYLSTLSFNGIHRVNLKGEFNVPYGQKTHLTPCDPHQIRAASAALQMATIRHCDFEDALLGAGEGDFVYLDPPYTVAHGNNGFVKYNAKIFSWKDQTRLANLAKELSGRGCRVVISNADHTSVRELYRGFNTLTVDRPSRIAASSSHRRRVSECIFYN